MKINKIAILIPAVILLALAGCEKSAQADWDNLKQLQKENSSLKIRLQNLEVTNENLTNQITSLTKLDKDVRLDAFAALDKIEISKRSGLYDKDEDQKFESLIIYIKPFDENGDIVKAPGSVELQLWDLNTESNQALLTEWSIPPQQMKERWMGIMMTDYYRITKDVSDIVKDPTKDLTLKAKFTDYLTGKVLKDQLLIHGKESK